MPGVADELLQHPVYNRGLGVVCIGWEPFEDARGRRSLGAPELNSHQTATAQDPPQQR